jgi:hypothetical protein
MPDETQDDKPHVNIHAEVPAAAPGLSIWFFCGILMLAYGIVLVGEAGLEHFQLLGQHSPTTVLAHLHPTFWWGGCLFLFGAFYTLRFRPGKA